MLQKTLKFLKHFILSVNIKGYNFIPGYNNCRYRKTKMVLFAWPSICYYRINYEHLAYFFSEGKEDVHTEIWLTRELPHYDSNFKLFQSILYTLWQPWYDHMRSVSVLLGNQKNFIVILGQFISSFILKMLSALWTHSALYCLHSVFLENADLVNCKNPSISAIATWKC